VSTQVIVVMPAYNAEQTLKTTYHDLPLDLIQEIILVDDGSKDRTLEIARELGLKVFCHDRNYGYGANQKTCYIEALKTDAKVIVMVHPDYQYDPKLLPEIIQPILDRSADVVLGSRMIGTSALEQGMPWWKYYSNRFLTAVENWVFGLRLSEYHTGYRAYSREVLEVVNFQSNSDAFIFDQEIIAQMVQSRFRITEVPVPVRYFPEASSAGFGPSLVYGVSILWLLFRFWVHKTRLWQVHQFDSLKSRYHQVS
jgi:glycosyltransferase involved in cell wall biosynthesis